jgi:CRP-like cAMP-binding protein
MSLTKDVKARRNSCLGIPQKYFTEAFKRKSITGTVTNPYNNFKDKQTHDELQEESEKLKKFIKKICSNSEARKDSSETAALKKMTNYFISQFGSSKSVIRKISHTSSKHVPDTPSNKVKRESQHSKASEELEIQAYEERSLKKINKVSDSEVSEDLQIELNDDLTVERWIINPECKYYRLWVILVFICLIYIFSIDTYILGFLDEEPYVTIVIGLIIDIIYILDFIVNFFIAYYDFDENLITKQKSIILNYLKNGFTIDLLTVVPFSIILNPQLSDNPLNQQYKIIRIAQITKISKIPRVLKLAKLVKMFKRDTAFFRFNFLDDLNIHSNRKRFIGFFAYFLIFNHISTCLWVFVGKLDYPNWIFKAGLQDVNNITLYVHALYFNFTTVFTVGYGDITSINLYERVYNIAIMWVGVLLYSFAITSLSNIVKMDKKEKRYNKNIELLQDIKNKYRINHDLYKLLKRYLSYDLKKNRVNRKYLLNELPQQLKHTITHQIYKSQIQQLNFFKDTPNEFVIRAVTLLRPLKLFKSELIIKSGNYLDEMYFIKRGRAIILLPINRSKHLKLLHFHKNEHFGEIYMCKRLRCPVDLKVCSKECELYSLSKTVFIELNEEFPKVIQNLIRKSLVNTTKMELYAKEMLLKMSSQNKPQSIIQTNLAHLIFEDEIKPYDEQDVIPNSMIKQPLQEFSNPYLQLIDFKSANDNEIITEENSSAYSNLTIKEAPKEESISKSSNKVGGETISHSKVITVNNEKVLFKINTIHSPNVEITPRNTGSQVNINYNINIQNNLNFSELSKMLANPPLAKDNLKSIINDSNSKVTHVIEADDSIRIRINNKEISPKIIRPQPHKVVTLPYNLSTIQKDDSVSSQHTDSFDDNIKEVYEKHRNTPEIKKLRSSSLFDIFITKYKQRKSLSGVTKSPPPRKNTAISKFLSLRKEDMDDINLNKTEKTELKLQNYNISPKFRGNRSSSFRDMKRLSKIHYNDILENMKKDAMVKKNPNSVIFKDIHTINSSKKTNKFSLRENQVERICELYESLIETLFFRMKSRQINKE